MKKKQKTKSAAPAAAESVTPSLIDLKTLIHDNTAFFDKLIELIPAKFYLPSDDAKPWFQGLSKAAKASAKQQTRENIKKARRDRLDPEKSQSSTLDLLKKSLVNDKTAKTSTSANDVGDNDDSDNKSTINFDGGRSVTYEELRQKLHRKIELLRGNRGGGGEKPRAEKKGRENQQKKRDRNECERKDDSDGKVDGHLQKNERQIEKEVDEATKGIEFGQVKIGGEEDGREKKKRKKMSKMKELERAKRLEEVRRDNPAFAKKQSWKDAASKAMGVKVHDNPKLLKGSIKKEKKRREKNAKKWKERVEATEKSREEKQQKRAGNIADRIHQKKMRKIAKREKKLMRPGFEGRKEGYITED